MGIGTFTQGCDPEFFLWDPKFERYISAIPFVTGTKNQPEPLPSGGYIMRDNVAVEFGMPPAYTVDEWVDNVNKNIEAVSQYIPRHLELRIVPSANFPKQQLCHPEAAEIGCAPDFNAWTGEQNIPPLGFAKSTFRSCGGHIHVGYVENSGNDFLLDPKGKTDTIKAMDCFLGFVSLLLDNSKAAIERRNIYGKAGCYRPTKYGVEYRTLSNFWCKTDDLKRLVYNLTADALRCVREGTLYSLIGLLGGPDNIQEAINIGNSTFVRNNLDVLTQNMSNESVLHKIKIER